MDQMTHAADGGFVWLVLLGVLILFDASTRRDGLDWPRPFGDGADRSSFRYRRGR
ncbi:MAG TPA: hypothetical protein VFO05_00260 [Candidatus Limnocylindrales bacterium]|nr:hypothetical protein [Candidatus Limnocylindrales bacterium]